jgi:hypothetical protein
MFPETRFAISLQIQSGLFARLRLRGGRRDQGDGRRPGFASQRTCCRNLSQGFEDVRHAR